jgi:hypothetical protein
MAKTSEDAFPITKKIILKINVIIFVYNSREMIHHHTKMHWTTKGERTDLMASTSPLQNNCPHL